ncbi:type II toxin-antitoxin system RelE/ParE family toxin [Pseudomonas syringae]|uniref:type II toxin-antitoxin system RelE/ParE family toxin n=1 Tax=Pseudomonas syringae TaxID=317 RepID=UPI0004645050|nr:type II toxin-antitoxin system RelE/ParE family toxin [Pseudomonas syringae]
MIVVWTPEAEQDRNDIWDYIAVDNPRAGSEIDSLFSDAVSRLATHTKMGKAEKIVAICELIPHENYRLIYEVEQEIVRILALVQTACLWPPAREQR